MTAIKPLVAGNWKMNGSMAENDTLLDALLTKVTAENVEVVVFPPAVYLPQAIAKTKNSLIKVGAQDISSQEKGAYTGEVSGAMLKDIGCEYAMIGHSERRQYHGETDADVAAKMVKALEYGLTPIICIGETLDERESGNMEKVIERQLSTVIDIVGIEKFETAVIAYEPVWAIGTGKTATPEQAEEVHQLIRCTLEKYDDKIAGSIRILYGGSVNAGNAERLFEEKNINGALVGGASLKADDFNTIIAAR